MVETLKLKQMLFPVDDSAPLAERAYRSLQGEVVTLGFRPGRALKEADLQQILGFGRTPIREALLRLAAEGLVVMHAHQGTFVSDTNIKDLASIYEIRRPLEGLAAKLAALRLNEAGRQRLAASRVALREELEHPTTIGALVLDHQLHELIYDLSGNERLRHMLTILLNLSFRLHLEIGERAPTPVFAEATSAMQKESALLDAIAEQRADEAQELAEHHAEASEHILRMAF